MIPDKYKAHKLLAQPYQMADVEELNKEFLDLYTIAEEMAEALDSVWYSEFSRSETCLEGEQIKQALQRFQSIGGVE